jgi:hypothetical protein
MGRTTARERAFGKLGRGPGQGVVGRDRVPRRCAGRGTRRPGREGREVERRLGVQRMDPGLSLQARGSDGA